MAPKRTRKINVGVEDLNKYNNIILDDVLCPICRSILIEPVTLPCNHGFCLSCFNGTMENNTLTCPLCRIRIASWLRTARKENKLVNCNLWQSIQSKFSSEIQKKKSGIDVLTEERVTIRLSNPGEIRREYQLQLARERSEVEKQRDAEEKASELVIKHILEEENTKAHLEAEKIRLDEEFAQRLANQLLESVQSVPGPSTSKHHSNVQSKQINIGSANTLDSFITTHQIDPSFNSRITQKKIVLEKSQTIQKLASKTHTSTILCQSRKDKGKSLYKNFHLNKVLKYALNNPGRETDRILTKEDMYFKPVDPAPTTSPKLNEHGLPTRHPKLLRLFYGFSEPPLEPNIQRPNNRIDFKRLNSENSAFVKYPSKAVATCTQVKASTPQKSVTNNILVTETGKSIKQYYNKRIYTHTKDELNISQESSPLCSPVYGFEKPNGNRCNNLVKSLVKSISESLTKNSQHGDSKQYLNNDNSLSDASDPKPSTSKIRKQLDMDLEYAKKLHEELNRPQRRGTRSVANSYTNEKLRKRQITLDEFVTPKKLKT